MSGKPSGTCMNEATIAFVRGVDRHGAKPPEGLPHRFAVLTWFDHEGGMADPWPLMRTAIPRVAALVGAGRVVAEDWERRRTGLLFRRWTERLAGTVAWDELVRADDDTLRERGFPDRLRFLVGERTVLAAWTERWTAVGGPAPYHDSVTVSFFGATPLEDALRTLFVEEAGRLGVAVRESPEAGTPP